MYNNYEYFYYFLILKSKASRNPSPIKLKAKTDIIKNKPGNKDNPGAIRKKSFPSFIIVPQLGIDGGNPNPKKDKPASLIIALEIPKLYIIIIGPTQLGSICLTIILMFE